MKRTKNLVVEVWQTDSPVHLLHQQHSCQPDVGKTIGTSLRIIVCTNFSNAYQPMHNLYHFPTPLLPVEFKLKTYAWMELFGWPTESNPQNWNTRHLRNMKMKEKKMKCQHILPLLPWSFLSLLKLDFAMACTLAAHQKFSSRCKFPGAEKTAERFQVKI